MDTVLNPPPSKPEKWTLEWLLHGPDGLRAGWGLIFFVILFFLAQITLHSLMPRSASPQGAHLISPGQVYFGEVAGFLIVLIITWLLSLIEDRPLRAYGLGNTPRALPQFLAGLAWGAILLSLLVGILWRAHLLEFNARLLAGDSITNYALLWLGGFLLVGLAEEYLVRGYLQFILARALTSLYHLFLPTAQSKPLGFWSAALILSILFGLGHSSNPGESPLGLVAATLAGLIFCLVLWRTGSLWWAVGFHCTWDWAQSFLYGVGDSGGFIQDRLFDTTPIGRPILSGGLTGPEGSVFVVPVLGLAALVILTTLPRRKGPQTAPNLTQDTASEIS